VTPAIPATPPKGEVKSMATGILNLLLLWNQLSLITIYLKTWHPRGGWCGRVDTVSDLWVRYPSRTTSLAILGKSTCISSSFERDVKPRYPECAHQKVGIAKAAPSLSCVYVIFSHCASLCR
jgi:hypothetical protein